MAASSYYDLNAILTDSQKIPCTFELTVPSLGYLGGNAGEDIKSGAKLELPALARRDACRQPHRWQ